MATAIPSSPGLDFVSAALLKAPVAQFSSAAQFAATFTGCSCGFALRCSTLSLEGLQVLDHRLHTKIRTVKPCACLHKVAWSHPRAAVGCGCVECDKAKVVSQKASDNRRQDTGSEIASLC